MRILNGRLVTRWRVVESRQIGNRCRKSERARARNGFHAPVTPVILRYYSHILCGRRVNTCWRPCITDTYAGLTNRDHTAITGIYNTLSRRLMGRAVPILSTEALKLPADIITPQINHSTHSALRRWPSYIEINIAFAEHYKMETNEKYFLDWFIWGLI